MLFVSSRIPDSTQRLDSVEFQSRNRDAFRFKASASPVYGRYRQVSISESRCFSFQGGMSLPTNTPLLWFQSRNRDAFRFKASRAKLKPTPLTSFNLGIEMLFVSSNKNPYFTTCDYLVSISESRCFSFQASDP